MPPLDPAMPERIRAAADALIEQHRMPALSIGVVDGDELVYSESFGYADIETKEPMRPERRQRIASITKTMVGLCAMALVDEGKLSLDTRAVDVLPEVVFEGPADKIMLRHLLTHTSGIGEAPTLARLRDVSNPNREAVVQPGGFDALYPDGVIVEVEPGTKWSYCNNGYALLGEIISRTEGASLQDVMERRIFGPLGMSDTDIRDENDDRITSCYHRDPSDDTRFQLERAGIEFKDEATVDGLNIRGGFTAEFNQGMRAAGGVQSTIPDMAKYASALLRRGAGIVRPQTFDAMTSPQIGDDPRMIAWGLSFARSPLYASGTAPAKWRTFIGHGGAYYGGWNSHIDVLRGENLAVVQHMNIMMDESMAVFRPILRAVMDVEQSAFPERATDAAILESAPGMYELPMPGPLTNFRPQTRVGRLQIERDGDALLLRSRWGKWKTGVRMVPCDGNDPGFFAVPGADGDAAYIALDRDSAGRVTALRLDDLVRMPRRADS